MAVDGMALMGEKDQFGSTSAMIWMAQRRITARPVFHWRRLHSDNVAALGGEIMRSSALSECLGDSQPYSLEEEPRRTLSLRTRIGRPRCLIVGEKRATEKRV
jgi:hypothetical protein